MGTVCSPHLETPAVKQEIETRKFTNTAAEAIETDPGSKVLWKKRTSPSKGVLSPPQARHGYTQIGRQTDSIKRR